MAVSLFACRGISSILVVLGGAVMVTAALAQNSSGELNTLDAIEQAGVTIPSVPQDPKRAAEIRQVLERIVLPPGFEIALYAIVPGARQMAVGPNAGVVFVGTRTRDVWAVADRDSDGVADDVKAFVPGLRKVRPNGVAFDAQGTLYIAEHSRILAFPDAELTYESPVVPISLVTDRLVPAETAHGAHDFRVIDVGPDDKLYVAIGQPYNVWPRDRPMQDPFGTIVRMKTDGSEYQVFARGIRNSVGLDFHPVTGELWFTDNQVDGMGDDVPPGELNRAPLAGLSFGFPWYGGGDVRTVEWRDAAVPVGEVFPEVEYVAHAADLGMTFYTGSQFPAAFKNDVFNAQHGSWDRTVPIGARIMHVDMDRAGRAVSHSVFASGWLDDSTGAYSGRPVDVIEMPDGALLVSDDFAGAIYRITYVGE